MFGTQFGRIHNSPNLVTLVSGEEYSAEGQHYSSSFHPDFTESTSEGYDPFVDNNNTERARSSDKSHTVVKEGNGIIREFTDGLVVERTYQWKETLNPITLTPGPVINSNKGRNNPTQRPTFENTSTDFRDFEWRNPDQQSFHEAQYHHNGQNDPKVSPEGQDNSKTSLIGPSISTTNSPSVYPDRRATKCEPGKKRRLRITDDRKKTMIQYYRRKKNEDIHSEYFQRGLYLDMKSKDPQVTLEDVKRWHGEHYMKLAEFASINTSPLRRRGARHF